MQTMGNLRWCKRGMAIRHKPVEGSTGLADSFDLAEARNKGARIVPADRLVKLGSG